MTDRECASHAFCDLLELAAIGATGKKVLIRVEDWPEVIKLSQEQFVLPLVGIALLKNPEIDCPEDLRSRVIEIARSQSSANLIRKHRILNLLHEMEEAGLHAQLIKGYPIGECYAFPESRGSNDTDILISSDQEEAVCAFLRNLGFRIDKRGKTSHHAIGQHPKLGMVEIHVQLYAELMREVWFQDGKKDIEIKEDYIRIETDHTPYSSLGHTDHLLFLTLHTIKHFIFSGMGIRMMLDMALYYSKHKNEIDLKRYWRILDELRYTDFVNAVFWSLIDTGIFDISDFAGISSERPLGIQELLYDLEVGGHMGINGSWPDGLYEYSRRLLMRSKSLGQYRIYMIRMKLRDAYQNMFPDKEGLCRIYPILNKHGQLLAIFRVYRMFSYPIQKICSGALRKQLRSGSSDMPEEAKRRVDLFKTLGMI